MSFFKKLTSKLTAPDANVQLKLNKYGIALGENVEGTLTVFSKEDFDATEVRCEIQCVEEAKTIKHLYDPSLKRTVPREVRDSAVLFAVKPVLSGPTHFARSQTREFPLNISIPVGCRFSYQSIDRRAAWTIKGVAAVDGRPDITTRAMEIQVAAPTVQPVIKEKEIIREVVMVPCKYCGGLMSQTETVCPNCGAKRTV